MSRSQQRALFGLLLIIAGIVVAIVGYLGVSDETTVAFQLPYFASAGVGALMLLAGGGVLLVLAQIERDGERFDQLEDATRQLAREIGRLLDEVDHDQRGTVISQLSTVHSPRPHRRSG
jgi:hypothetical protein